MRKYQKRSDTDILNMNLYYWELGCAMYLDCPEDPSYSRVCQMSDLLEAECEARGLEMCYDPIGQAYLPLNVMEILS